MVICRPGPPVPAPMDPERLNHPIRPGVPRGDVGEPRLVWHDSHFLPQIRNTLYGVSKKQDNNILLWGWPEIDKNFQEFLDFSLDSGNCTKYSGKKWVNVDRGVFKTRS